MTTYTFLPYLRRGIVGLANANVEKDRLHVPLRLQVIGEGEDLPLPIERPVQLYGPGDISGINHQAIVRTVPRYGVNDFEANFLAAVEFYDEDFLWRYSPIIPEQGGKINPWLWLIVLTENEFERISSVKNSLPIIKILSEAMQSAFPTPETIASWAHVHLNFEPAGATAKAFGDSIQQKLDENPNLGCSRLVCPRRLSPNTMYRGFVIPSFEKGRLAGLGRPEAEIANIPNLQPSWSNTTETLNSTHFPVYFEWPFSTSSAGDFEDLARKLSPLTPQEQKELREGVKQLDVRNPGWGIEGATGAIEMESALKFPGTKPDSQSEFNDNTLGKKLAELLNQSITPLNSQKAKTKVHPYFKEEKDPNKQSNLDDDPIITPPIYGSFYRPAEMLHADNSQNWYEQLNLNPVLRIAAAQGTAVVQQDQEELIDIAWDQLGRYADTLKMRNRWKFSEQLSQIMSVKRVKPKIDVNNPEAHYRSVSFFSPLIPTLQTGGTTNQILGSLVTANADKPSTFSPAFLKVTRSGGPLMRRLSDKPAGVFFADKQKPVFSGQVSTTPIQKAINSILNWLNDNPDASTKLKSSGLGGVEPLKMATSFWLPYINKQSHKINRRTDVHNIALAGIWTQIEPVNTIMSRFESMVGITISSGGSASTDNFPPPPIFKNPTYAQLAERNRDYILPGLEKIPSNRVAILETNSNFIESYLVGLNHEMAREFLWREFPAPLNATYFNQFWDMRNTTSPKPDIQPILQWKPDSKIGTHGSSAGQTNIKDPIVVVIRGDLIRKYPNTEIFMVKADWENKNSGSHKLVLDVNNQSQWINESPHLHRPFFSARIDPDYTFLGFNISLEEVKGDDENPGWFFVLKERAGETHFGLDLNIEVNNSDPSWEQLAEVAENQCIQVDSARFNELPGAGKRADQVASMLYQKPFMLFVHASRVLP